MSSKFSRQRNFKNNTDQRSGSLENKERKFMDREEKGERNYIRISRVPNEKFQSRSKFTEGPIKISSLLLKYSCRLCGQFTPRVLHPSNFLQQCRRCNSSSHLKNLSSSFRMLMGTYECQQQRCNARWVQKLPFKNVIMNTPVCHRCHKLTKISQIFYNGVRVTFKNSLLYKCNSCSKSKSISLYKATQSARENMCEGSEQPPNFSLNPKCDNCHIPMNFIKNMRSILFGLANDVPGRRAKSQSPQNVHLEPPHKNKEFRENKLISMPLATRHLQSDPYSKYSTPQRGAFRGRGFYRGGSSRGSFSSRGRGRGGHNYSKNYLPRPGRFAKSHGDSPQEAEEIPQVHFEEEGEVHQTSEAKLDQQESN